MSEQAEASLRFDLDTRQLASEYDICSDYQYDVGLSLIEAVRISPRDRVLDVGAGTGRLASYIADSVTREGLVLGIDPLKNRIDVARNIIASNLEFSVGNAHDLSRFSSDYFDVVLLNCVFHWLQDHTQALREIARVLKPGGLLGISTPSRNRSFSPFDIKRTVLSGENYRNYSRDMSEPVKMFTANEMSDLLNSSGFICRTISALPTTIKGQNSEDVMKLVQASSFGNYLEHLPENLRTAASEEIQQSFDRLRTDSGIPLELEMLVIVSVKN
ncbi:hypothetical protein N7462_005811 [Penicillium macrosclerotiorum]|uniref:uncharacterized protein n=1 Tax=Penicillium macrosclerotiorum TaxID=303699 RepID=UPI002549616E|nr:uncharacterized protein N7462_005811 [Penicillium macrosclerotiorum]KAJ5682646.1 hypothetical protein N7462_005811 [Penicillium macrosclerotiorum]